MKNLIVNADDLAWTEGVNRGIREGHEHGIVTSATLMACGKRFGEATSLAKTLPRLGVGCHVVLVDGQPMANSAEIQSLLMGDSATFQDKLMSFAARAASGRLEPTPARSRPAKAAPNAIRVSGLNTVMKKLDVQ